MSWSQYGDYDSASWYGHWPPPSAFIQFQRMQAQAQQMGRRPATEADFATHAHFPGHKQGMAPYTCPPWTCTNKLCKAVNDTGKPKLLECRLCAEPRPLATTLWALEHFGGPGLATAKRMMAEGRRAKGAGKGTPPPWIKEPAPSQAPPPWIKSAAPATSQASKGGGKGGNPKGKGKGKGADLTTTLQPQAPTLPQVSKEALAILRETGHDPTKKATELDTPQDKDEDMGQDDVWEEDPILAQEQQVEDLTAYRADLEEKGDPYNLVKHLTEQLQGAKKKLDAMVKKSQENKARLGPKPPEKVSVLASKQAELAKQIAQTQRQKEAAEADYDNRLKQKTAQKEKVDKELQELTQQRQEKVSQLEELLEALERSTASLEQQVRARVSHRTKCSEDENGTESEDGWTDDQGGRWQEASKQGHQDEQNDHPSRPSLPEQEGNKEGVRNSNPAGQQAGLRADVRLLRESHQKRLGDEGRGCSSSGPRFSFGCSKRCRLSCRSTPSTGN